jgi:dihydroxyacetone kinase-like protein
MKKFLNSPAGMQRESLAGFAQAWHDIVALDPDGRFVRRRQTRAGKVALISGGGSGHEPLHIGFVGRGMLDAACPGQVFSSPTPDQIVQAARAVDGGAGRLLIVKNYAGDRMNFALAAELCGPGTGVVLVDDDVALADSAREAGRRGVAGTLVVEKLLGAAAERGDGLESLRVLGPRAVAATRSMGVALTSCTVPTVGRPTFEIGAGEMEVGVGIHGEAGSRRVPLMSADRIARELVEAVLADLVPRAGRGEVLLLVNGCGATPLAELYLMFGAASRELQRHGCRVVRSLVGNFVTSLDMAGCSVTVTRLDGELAGLWDAPVQTAALRWGV